MPGRCDGAPRRDLDLPAAPMQNKTRDAALCVLEERSLP